MTLRSFYKFITFFNPIELKNNTSKRVFPTTSLLSKDEILLKGSVITKVKTENERNFHNKEVRKPHLNFQQFLTYRKHALWFKLSYIYLI